MKVLTVYLDLIERFYKFTDMQDRITIDKARQILSMHYHFPRNRITAILNDLKDLGLINLANCRWIYVLWKPPID